MLATIAHIRHSLKRVSCRTAKACDLTGEPCASAALLQRLLRLRSWFRQFTRVAALLQVALVFLFIPAAFGSVSLNRPFVVLVVGASGEDIYEPIFAKCEKLWREAALKGGAEVATVGLEAIPNVESDHDRKKLQGLVENFKQTNSAPAWIVFIGHGTDNGKEAKFNLRGPDVSAAELAEWLKPAQRPLIIVNTASCSGAFIKPLSAANRIIVTSTRSGNEINFAHFGEYMAESIGSLEADLDKDEQTSLLEAFLMASRRVADFYKDEGRLATEHSLIDDNGDGLGTPADWFQGVRAVKKPEKGQADGRRAHRVHLISNAADQRLTAEQRSKRDELETAINNLRDRKGKMPKNDYYRELEGLLLQMARVYEESEANK